MEKFVITNTSGWTAEFVRWGAMLVALKLHREDQSNEPIDVVLSVPDEEQGLAVGPYFGVIAGRYANRIRDGKFTLDNETFQLDQNEGETTLHGGAEGLHQKQWTVLSHASDSIQFQCRSAEGESGFPGNLVVKVSYAWQGSQLQLSIEATTDKATPVNLCQHHYFNLNGVNKGNVRPVLNHHLQMDAEHFLAIDTLQVPTGEVRSVMGTALDFRDGQDLALAVNSDDPNLQVTQGIDHCFVAPFNSGILLESPLTGCRMCVTSDQPAVQVYTGNLLGETPGKDGKVYPQYGGICLEAQRYPDGPNHAHFPNCILRPGEDYTQTTAFDFQFVRPRDSHLN